jgi:hypothetical protein
MKAASLKELKTELQLLHHDRIIELCMRLIKFRKENKELLTYLLFESDDEQAYTESIKEEMAELFKEVNTRNTFYAKKTIRKILRLINKYIKYSGSKQTEADLLIAFCKHLKSLHLPLSENTVLGNLYRRQILRIKKATATLHEDLQHDYSEELQNL